VKYTVNIRKKCVLVPLLLLLLSSCTVSRYIDEQTVLLQTNKTVFKGISSTAEKENYTLEIEQLYRQKGITPFNAWRYYYLSRPRKDTSALAQYLLKRSKKPDIYSEDEALLTSKSINNYMIQRGYFNAQTTHTLSAKGKWSAVT
jgi:hypothetical protein